MHQAKASRRMSTMPKHGWKWRTEALSRLSVQEMIEWLNGARVSPKLVRWIFLHYADGPYDWTTSHHDAPDAIFAIDRALAKLFGKEERPKWVKSFLWRELYKHKADLLGERIADCGYLFVEGDPDAAHRLMDLHEDEEAHPFTRGNVLYALLFAPIPEELMPRLQRTVRDALNDENNSYARCTACMLSSRDPSIELKDLEPLLTDDAGLKHGWVPKVSEYAQDAYDQLSQRRST